MKLKSKIREQKGSITLYVLTSMLLFTIVILALYVNRTEFYAPYVDPGYDFFTELSRIYEERQQEGEAYDRMYENGSETAGEE